MRQPSQSLVAFFLCAVATTAHGQSLWGPSPWEQTATSGDDWVTRREAANQTLEFRTARQEDVTDDPESTPSASDRLPSTAEPPLDSGTLGSGALPESGATSDDLYRRDEISQSDHLYQNNAGLTCAEGYCDPAYLEQPCCGWFGGIYGVGLSLQKGYGTDVSYDSQNPFPALLTTNSAAVDYGPGFETRLGKYLNQCWGVEFSYWGVYPSREEEGVSSAATSVDLASAIDFDGLLYDNGVTEDSVAAWFGTLASPATAHRVRRNFEAHNIELNLIRNPYRRNAGTHFELIAGLRYLLLDESFGFDSSLTNNVFGVDPANDLYYDVEVDNHLIGFQVGGRLDHYLSKRIAVNCGSKFGIFGNRIQHRQSVVSGNGVYATNVVTGEDYRFDVTDNEVSFLGELFAGLTYDISHHWRVSGGYRAVTASDVARSVGNIPRAGEFGSWERVQATNSTDSLLLHGAYLGLEYNW